MRRLILKTRFSLGDVVMMTAAVRDLHRCYPNQFETDVRTHFDEVWENNPFLTCLDEREPGVEVIDCRYPLINHANARPYHCLHGYIDFLNHRLNLAIQPTEFRGDIHLSAEEKDWASQVHEVAGSDIPFWIVAAGGKHDLTIKWWATARYQKVIDHFRGRIVFVQIGDLGHHHPKLEGVIDLRGQTNVRELIRLVYHAQGCLCSVTALMHLAAAVETKAGSPRNRACVVVAGGREPPHWEAYPHHQFLHTVGMLDCCSEGGCWRSRTLPLGDGDHRDKPANLCAKTAAALPRCMDMISPEQVIEKIEGYFADRSRRYLNRSQSASAETAIKKSGANTYDSDCLHRFNAAQAMQRAGSAVGRYPSQRYKGRGIVICGGGVRYFPCAWVCIQMLRQLGCRLPIEFWYQDGAEMDPAMIALLERAEVKCVDASQMAERYPRRTTGGWELKSYALLHSSFREVLLLDADNVPVKNPTYLFETADYQASGTLFWPDYGSLGPEKKIWSICGLAHQEEPAFESGQMLVDKARCWRAVNLAFWMNDHSDFFYQFIHGDKDTFHLAWRKLGQPYAMIGTPVHSLDGTMCQHDPAGERVFQHRNRRKWRVFSENKRVRGFLFEAECRGFLRQLEALWDGRVHPHIHGSVEQDGLLFRLGTCDRNVFHNVCDKNEYELPDQLSGPGVIVDVGAHIGSFSFACLARGARRVVAFEADARNVQIAKHNLRRFGRRVQLCEGAVWRSDRHPGWLLYSGYPERTHEVNTGGGTVLASAEASPNHERKPSVPTISLDSILRRYKRVQLLKLDCEGSEWPILFTAGLLGKVEAICGEFHELNPIPTAAQVSGFVRYTRKELEDFLRARYKCVRVQTRGGAKLGLFWATDPIAG